MKKISEVKTIFELDQYMLERAKQLPIGMNSSAASGLTDQQMQQLMNDPQMVELGGNLYIAKFFHYITNFAFAGNGTIPATLQIDSDADFQLLNILGSRDNNAVTVNVTEGGAGGLAWMSSPVNIDNFIGTAQLPFPAGLIPQLLPKKRVYQFSLVNSSGGANNVQISFVGYKLFPAASAAQLGAAPSQN